MRPGRGPVAQQLPMVASGGRHASSGTVPLGTSTSGPEPVPGRVRVAGPAPPTSPRRGCCGCSAGDWSARRWSAPGRRRAACRSRCRGPFRRPSGPPGRRSEPARRSSRCSPGGRSRPAGPGRWPRARRRGHRPQRVGRPDRRTRAAGQGRLQAVGAGRHVRPAARASGATAAPAATGQLRREGGEAVRLGVHPHREVVQGARRTASSRRDRPSQAVPSVVWSSIVSSVEITSSGSAPAASTVSSPAEAPPAAGSAFGLLDQPPASSVEPRAGEVEQGLTRASPASASWVCSVPRFSP